MNKDDLISSIEKNGFVNLEGSVAKAVKGQIEDHIFGNLLSQDSAGTYIYDVKLRGEVENTASSHGSLKIEPHTDGALTETPPKYVALFGKYVSEDESCRTHICKVSDLLAFLTSEERDILRLPTPGDGVFKYSFQHALYGDFWITEEQLKKRFGDRSLDVVSATNRMVKAFEQYGSSLNIKQGDLLIFDNHATLHYRDDVSSPQRHLLRYWIAG